MYSSTNTSTNVQGKKKEEKRGEQKAIEVFISGEGRERKREGIYQLYYQSVKKMARAKVISLSRIWYTIIVVLIHLILVYFGIQQCYYNDRLLWPKSFSSARFELLFEKLCLITSLVLLFIFIYPALFHIGNYANDNHQLTINDLKNNKNSLYLNLWKHSFALSSTLHLIMSFLILISTVLIHAKQIMVGLKDSGKYFVIKKD
jgi:hypothetical protein